MESKEYETKKNAREIEIRNFGISRAWLMKHIVVFFSYVASHALHVMSFGYGLHDERMHVYSCILFCDVENRSSFAKKKSFFSLFRKKKKLLNTQHVLYPSWDGNLRHLSIICIDVDVSVPFYHIHADG